MNDQYIVRQFDSRGKVGNGWVIEFARWLNHMDASGYEFVQDIGHRLCVFKRK